MSQLNDESLRMLLSEVMCIVNCRPLSVNDLYDSSSTEPLTHNHFLTMKTKIVLPPPGEFQQADVYSRKRWRRVQYMLNVFWSRWKNEYLQTLQMWSKWNENTPEVFKGDIAIIKDDNQPRNDWLLAVVVETFPSEDGHVRKVKVRTGNGTQNYLERPIHKLVVLVEV